MHAAMLRHVDSGLLPGLVALVHHRGREHVETIGTQTFDGNGPTRRDTIFRLASMTKPITAAGAMILVEECKMRLDDPIDEWLPELKDRRVLRTIESPLDDTVPAQRRITLRDLLTFRSGYGELGFLAPTCPLQQAMSEARLTLGECGRMSATSVSSGGAFSESVRYSSSTFGASLAGHATRPPMTSGPTGWTR
jgi:CubicO group peptidase (beta-lactamase class C family)